MTSFLNYKKVTSHLSIIYVLGVLINLPTSSNSFVDPSSIKAWLPAVGSIDQYELAGLHEGDILHDPFRSQVFDNDQVLDLAEDKHAISKDKYLWPDGIVYYEFSEEYSLFPFEKFLIKSVMKDIEKNSCIVFKPRTDEYDYIKIIYDSFRCYSSVGRVGGKQVLSLGMLCVVWWDKGNIYHELFHALGFHHEHTRYDRDNHITVHWDNIKSEMKKNFIKRPEQISNTLDLPYDIGSVMHYSPHAFSKLFLLFPTLESKEKGIFFLRASSPSDLDYQKLAKLYGCSRQARRRIYTPPRMGSSQRRYNERRKPIHRKAPSTESGKSLSSSSLLKRIYEIFPDVSEKSSNVYNYSGNRTPVRRKKKSWFDFFS